MSRCGKTGGIPKTFHKARKETWLNVPENGKGMYLRWIISEWKKLTPAQKIEFNKNRPKNKNAKAGICKPKPKPKWTNNLVGRSWIKKWGEKLDQKTALKKWDHLVKTKGKTSGLRKTKLSPKQIATFVYEEFGIDTGAFDCLTARANKVRCRGPGDVNKEWTDIFDDNIKARKWKMFSITTGADKNGPPILSWEFWVDGPALPKEEEPA